MTDDSTLYYATKLYFIRFQMKMYGVILNNVKIISFPTITIFYWNFSRINAEIYFKLYTCLFQ